VASFFGLSIKSAVYAGAEYRYCAPEMLEFQIALTGWYKKPPSQNGMFNKPEPVNEIVQVCNAWGEVDRNRIGHRLR
jgi:hypothetical protein